MRLSAGLVSRNGIVGSKIKDTWLTSANIAKLPIHQQERGFAGSPVAETLHSQCGGPGFHAFSNSAPHLFALVVSLLSRVQLFVTPRTVAHQAPLSMGVSRKNTGVGGHFLLQGIFPTQGSNPCLLPWQVDSFHWATREAPPRPVLLKHWSDCVTLHLHPPRAAHGRVLGDGPWGSEPDYGEALAEGDGAARSGRGWNELAPSAEAQAADASVDWRLSPGQPRGPWAEMAGPCCEGAWATELNLAACQASLSITNSRSPPKPMSIKSVMPSSHLILCPPRLLLPSIPPSIRVFSSESALHIRWPKY